MYALFGKYIIFLVYILLCTINISRTNLNIFLLWLWLRKPCGVIRLKTPLKGIIGWYQIINNDPQLKWKISIAFNQQRYKHLNIHFVMWLTKSLQSWPSSSADCVASSVQKWDGIGDWHKERRVSRVNNDEVSKMKSKVTAERLKHSHILILGK